MRHRFTAPLGALAITALAFACGTPAGTPVVAPGGNPASVGPCSPVEIISARGSLEPQAGSTVIGRINRALVAAIPGATRYEVHYPAGTDFSKSPLKGATDLVNHLVAQAAACPAQRYVFTGYSQGTIVLQLSYGSVPAGVSERVVAVALFGSPYHKPGAPGNAGTAPDAPGTYPERQPAAWAARTIDFCNTDDIVCGAGASVAAHSSYNNDAQARETVAFVVGKLG
jgi:cutinase